MATWCPRRKQMGSQCCWTGISGQKKNNQAQGNRTCPLGGEVRVGDLRKSEFQAEETVRNSDGHEVERTRSVVEGGSEGCGCLSNRYTDGRGRRGRFGCARYQGQTC